MVPVLILPTLVPEVPCGMITGRAMGSSIHNLPHLYVHAAQPAPMPTSRASTAMVAVAGNAATAWCAMTLTATAVNPLSTRTTHAKAPTTSITETTDTSTPMPGNWFVMISITQLRRGHGDVRVSTVDTIVLTSTTTRISGHLMLIRAPI